MELPPAYEPPKKPGENANVCNKDSFPCINDCWAAGGTVLGQCVNVSGEIVCIKAMGGVL